MKCNMPKLSKEKNWMDCYANMRDNLLLILDVLHEEYGFGKKKLDNLLMKVHERVKEFDIWQAEDVIDYKTDEIQKRVLTDEAALYEFLKHRAQNFLSEDAYNCFVSSVPSDSQAQAKFKRNTRQVKNNTSFSEATAIADKLQGLKAFQEDVGIIPGGAHEKIQRCCRNRNNDR